MTVSEWRKAAGSGSTNSCVELTWDGRLRDSKNPGVVLSAAGLLALARAYGERAGASR